MNNSILVIEDDREINRLLCMALTGCGYVPTEPHLQECRGWIF